MTVQSSKNYKLSYLAEFTEADLKGNAELIIESASGIAESDSSTITFADQFDYLKAALDSKAAAVVTKAEFLTRLASSTKNKSFLLTTNPRTVYARIANLLSATPYYTGEISADAVIADSVKLGKNISIHAGVVISERVEVADNTIIAPGVIIGPDVKLGKACLLHPGVIVERDSRLGDNVIIQSGSVIGSDGFGFATDNTGHYKIPQQGNVIIESGVEIGANVTIDRGASGPTIIHQGSKLDNLIQIAHNVEVGEESLIVSLTGIAGSTKLGRRVTLGGQSGIVGHIKLADYTTAAARAMVTASTKKGDFISGAPAREHRTALKEQAYLRRLPKYIEKIKQLEKRILELENNNLDKQD